MKFVPRRENDRKTIRFHNRSTEALGKVAGNWERVGIISLSNGGAGGSAEPGFGHVTTHKEDEFAHKGIDKQKAGYLGIIPKPVKK